MKWMLFARSPGCQGCHEVIAVLLVSYQEAAQTEGGSPESVLRKKTGEEAP